MKKVLIAGASGMIGNLILQQCIESSEVEHITILSRKASDIQHEKVLEVVVSDFTNYSEHADAFKNVDAAFFCIGVYTGQVPDEVFKTITVDYAVEFAKAVKEHSPDAIFCLLSGQGADRQEKSRMSFAKYKGMAENQISALGLRFHTFRPGYIYPVEKRKEPNSSYTMFRFLYPVLKPLFGKNGSIKSTELAKAMFHVGKNGARKEVLENRDILNFA